MKSLHLYILLLCGFCATYHSGNAQVTKQFNNQFISYHLSKDAFSLMNHNKVLPMVLDSSDWDGVFIAVKNLKSDFYKVTGSNAQIYTDLHNLKGRVIIIGTIGKSKIIDQLVADGKLNVSEINGKWESTIIQIVKSPTKSISSALVIAGSDKRGTIYGIYELSKQIGVSPWYWWADVPINKHESLYVNKTKILLKSPAVKYRGIFLNDEAPSLSGWTKEKFGGFNHNFYEKVFELLLRLKANYLWPAMWGNAFNDDDKLNPVMADRYGIVMGTSHHEPMLRAQQEWKRYGHGEWNYNTNKNVLDSFWKKGIENMLDHESIVTIGMRGDGDMPMSEGSNIALLEKIVQDQRSIIGSVTKKDPSKTPQLWALYKEVQDYYDKGMRVPDDVTLLLCDDNWGNIRKLPKFNDPNRSGGYGIYYHFDYVGDPRNYKWINTNPIDRVWEQMHLAYKYGADKIWIVNVGDLKPMEFPIQFFLDYAYDPDDISIDDLHDYTVRWCKEQFGGHFESDIAKILETYAKYNGRVKPELLNANTYSLIHFNEWDRVRKQYDVLAQQSETIYKQLPKKYLAAFYQLILFPVKASANLYDMYEAQAKNHYYAIQGRNLTDSMATMVKYFYQKDSLLAMEYNQKLSGGKWNHMMDQTHIGYTYWQQPEHNTMPSTSKVQLSSQPELGVTVQGDSIYFPKTLEPLYLPEASPYQKVNPFIEIFNRGRGALKYKIETPVNWIHPSSISGTLTHQKKINFSIDWKIAPKDIRTVSLSVISEDKKVIIILPIRNAPFQLPKSGAFVEQNGYIAIDAGDFTSSSSSDGRYWKIIPNFGLTKNAITPFPVHIHDTTFQQSSASVCYPFYSYDSGSFKLSVLVSPSLNMWPDQGLKFALSIDNQTPQIIDITKGTNSEILWRKDVAHNIRKLISTHNLENSGLHHLKIWAISPGVVLQKFMINFKPLKYSYLGPQASDFSIP